MAPAEGRFDWAILKTIFCGVERARTYDFNCSNCSSLIANGSPHPACNENIATIQDAANALGAIASPLGGPLKLLIKGEKWDAELACHDEVFDVVSGHVEKDSGFQHSWRLRECFAVSDDEQRLLDNCLGQLDLHPRVPDVLEQDTSEFRTPENRSTPFRVFAINGFSERRIGAGDQEPLSIGALRRGTCAAGTDCGERCATSEPEVRAPSHRRRARMIVADAYQSLAAKALAKETPVRRSPQGGGGSTPRRSQHEDAQAAACRIAEYSRARRTI